MSDCTQYELSYSNDGIKNYRKFAELPGFILLQSIDRIRGRYDILSAFPYDSCQSEFDLLKKKMRSCPSQSHLPFQGGAIGVFSYDLANAMAKIVPSIQQKLHDTALMDVGLYDWAFIVDHHLKTVTLVAANTQSETPSLVQEMKALWLDTRESSPAAAILKSPFTPLITKAAYKDAFHAIHADIKRGRCYQVNYTQPFSAHFEGSAWTLYETIAHYNPVPFAAFIKREEGDILCFSPERFIEKQGAHLLTSPIKGTVRRHPDQCIDNKLAEKLKNCSKNRAENAMIVDLMRNDLSKIALSGSVNVEALCAIESYREIHHLVSHISAQCPESMTSLEIFTACFPGGSITGAPKLEAMRVIVEQEAFYRGIYCGNIGYFSQHGNFTTNIAIRTLVAHHNTLWLWSGGGLVINSQCEDEYDECFTKIAAITQGL